MLHVDYNIGINMNLHMIYLQKKACFIDYFISRNVYKNSVMADFGNLCVSGNVLRTVAGASCSYPVRTIV